MLNEYIMNLQSFANQISNKHQPMIFYVDIINI